MKKEHLGVIPGLVEYVDMFLTKDMSGDEGYLLDKGLIPLPNFEENRNKVLSFL